LVAGLRPDPLLELPVLSQTPRWIKGEGARVEVGGRVKVGGRKEEGP